MVKYFQEQQYQQLVEDSTVFGFTKKNEINNGRWTMFGLLVGMMTEYATGVDFIDQIKLLVNVLGIADWIKNTLCLRVRRVLRVVLLGSVVVVVVF